MGGVSPVGVAFLAITLLTGFAGTAVYFTLAAASFYVHPPLFNILCTLAMRNWFCIVGLALQVVLGVKVFQSGPLDLRDKAAREKLMSKKVLILISNHRTRIDWLLLWAYLFYYPEFQGMLKIVLKEELKRVPIFGWAVQMLRFLTLSRKWEKDKEWIERWCSVFASGQDKTMLLLFPEGTDMSDLNIKRSKEYAEKNGLEPRTHTLQPRSTGFHALWNGMVREAGGAEHVGLLDLTMGYHDHEKGIRPSEKCLLDAKAPKGIFFHLELVGDPKYGSGDFALPPADGEACDKWMYDVFAAKDAMLTDFYAHYPPKGFDKTTKLLTPTAPEAVPKLIFQLLFWCFSFAVFLTIVTSGFGLIGLLVFFGWCSYMTHAGGGLDGMVLRRVEAMRGSTASKSK